MKILIFFLAGSTLCFSRINETLEQCTKRYGQPTEKEPYLPRTIRKIFLKDNYIVSVDFYKDKAYVIEYSRKDREKLTLAEVLAFKSIYSENWLPPRNIAEVQDQTTADGTMKMVILLTSYETCRIFNISTSNEVTTLYFEDQKMKSNDVKSKIKEKF